MKILLIGEFSGVHNNLKKGLVSLGHEVAIAADGDDYRGFNSDLKLKRYSIISKMNRIVRWLNHLRNILYLLKNHRTFFGNDIVQFISPFSIQSTYNFMCFLILRLNKKTIYYVCGTDPAFIKSAEHFKYFPFDDKNNIEYPKYDSFSLNYYYKFIKKIDLIIPSMFTYKVGYANNKRLYDPIPLPGNGEFTQKEEVGDKRINILHGITRYHFKGSDYILEALAELEKNFPNIVNVTIVEKLPFKEYVSLYKDADLVVDQCKSYDYGMNAIYAMEHGKIVLSGAEDVAMKYLDFDDCPVINITPDKNQILDQLENIIHKSASEISKMRKQNNLFANKHHNPENIAKKFEFVYYQ
jgi:hypothetical protein